MKPKHSEFISLLDIGMAYRKAKVDAFYSLIPERLNFLEYEQDLHNNLTLFHKTLSEPEPQFDLGSWTLIPKSPIDVPDDKDGFLSSDPQKKWKTLCRNTDKIPEATFRLMARPSIDFHVLSALWIAKIGCRYDACLNDAACGNRLRRKGNNDLNRYSLGNFKPYFKPFRDWRDSGLKKMRSSLNEGDSVVAVTADVSSFYHELNPDFMLSEDFHHKISLELKGDERLLNELFINALKQWAESTPLKKGLPVGLPASAIVANMALIELDHVIQCEIVPLYYGRYVDDIILVINNCANFSSPIEVWEWIFKRSDGLLKWKGNNNFAVQFAPSYLENSLVEFSKSKSKVFLLEGESGKTLINSLEHQIRTRASEWRALPNLPANPAHVAADLLSAVQADGEVADNLRKADILSMRKAGFAIKLRDFEAYERDLPPSAWVLHRKNFLRTFCCHVLVLPNFFDLANYLSRVIHLATACEDFWELREIINQIDMLIEMVEKDCKTNIKSIPRNDVPEEHNEIIKKWRKEIGRIIDEDIKAAFPTRLSRIGKKQWLEHFSGVLPFHITTDIKTLQGIQAKLFSHDLAHIPFRFIGLPKELASRRGIPNKKTVQCIADSDSLLEESIGQGMKIVGKLARLPCQDSIPFGLMFATRPYSLTELYLLHKTPYHKKSSQELYKGIFALRGFSPKDELPFQDKNILEIPSGKEKNNFHIALASWKTHSSSWTASVSQKNDPDLTRYKRLTHLLNEVLTSHTSLDYFVLPELSVPARWFLRIAQKLQRKGISLICGIEYLHKPKKIVHNQVWAALTYNGLGFTDMVIYRQDKQRPALHEEEELHRLSAITMKPENSWKTPPVVCHGGLYFALLICSELTNIAYRATLRGSIDVLLVPEWNQDTETFNALVESASLDIHAYIVQCNDRQYGDSRIRAPYKDSWKRDIVRIKGGKNDYFVVGKIDIQVLRQFQSSHHSPSEPFKPVPDGYRIGFNRIVLPKKQD
jgi:hypothetical protein